MRILRELGQLAITLVFSGVVATMIGPTYLAVAVLVLASCLILLFDSAQQHSEATETSIGVLSTLHILGTALVFGLIWPAIPLIFTWKRGDDA